MTDVLEVDVLNDASTGARVARGGLVRGVGYAIGGILSGVAAVLLLRHLGPVEFGQYAAIGALLGITSGVTDAGLNAIGARDMAILKSGPERDKVLANLVGMRLLITPVGVLIAIGVAAALGFDGRLILACAIGGIGVILVNVQTTMTLPLWVGLRITRLTFVEVLKQAIALAAIVTLVAAGASLLPFFAVQIVVGILALAITPWLLSGWRAMQPSLDRAVWAPLLRDALPLAIAVTLNVVYFRVLMIEMAVLSTDQQTGYFATAFRLMEFLIALPLLVTSVALPVLSVAGQNDLARLRAAVRALCEASLLAGLALAFIVAFAAGPIVEVLGGAGYEPAVAAVRIQALTLIPLFLGMALQVAIIATRRQRLLMIANGSALVAVLLAGLVVIPAHGAVGGSWVAVGGEALLTLILVIGAAVVERAWLPSVTVAAKIMMAAVLGICAGYFIPVGSDVVSAILAVVVLLGTAAVSGAVHPRILRAVVPLGRRS